VIYVGSIDERRDDRGSSESSVKISEKSLTLQEIFRSNPHDDPPSCSTQNARPCHKWLSVPLVFQRRTVSRGAFMGLWIGNHDCDGEQGRVLSLVNRWREFWKWEFRSKWVEMR